MLAIALKPNIIQGYERLIKPALAGVENVLTTALSISSLEKVVLTSSVAAVAGSKTKMPPGHRYSEADWNSVATETYLPYNRSAPASFINQKLRMVAPCLSESRTQYMHSNLDL